MARTIKRVAPHRATRALAIWPQATLRLTRPLCRMPSASISVTDRSIRMPAPIVPNSVATKTITPGDAHPSVAGISHQRSVLYATTSTMAVVMTRMGME